MPDHKQHAEADGHQAHDRAQPSRPQSGSGSHGQGLHTDERWRTKSYSVRGRIALGCVALVVWFGLFCGGLLIETAGYRALLAPHEFQSTPEIKPYEGSAVTAFFYSALWFTPTNLALLALSAGLLGGCVSNILVRDPAKPFETRRLKYLAEDPFAAMIRSFIVYLCIIGGLYLVTNDPFKDSTGSQYVRLAGMVSVLALLVGYDPSRILYWFELIQKSRSETSTRVEDRPDGAHVETMHEKREITYHDPYSDGNAPENSHSELPQAKPK